jgi:hypothetical protein
MAARRGRKVDWYGPRRAISWACKLYYLAFMVVFWHLEMPGMMFAFSAWILNDQYEKAFLSWDSDRTRRTFHDLWVFRTLYPGLLLLPLLSERMPLRPLFGAYGILLLLLWLSGLLFVGRKGRFLRMPDDPGLLRNIVYLPPPRG